MKLQGWKKTVQSEMGQTRSYIIVFSNAASNLYILRYKKYMSYRCGTALEISTEELWMNLAKLDESFYPVTTGKSVPKYWF